MDTGGFFVALLKKVAPLNARARMRFEALEKELRNTEQDEEGDKEKTGEDEGEPDSKKPKIEFAVEESDDCEMTEQSYVNSQDDGVKTDDTALNEEGSQETDELLFKHKNPKGPVHGFVKRNYLRGEDGKKSRTTGREDFIPCPPEIFEPLKSFYGLDDESFNEGQFMIRAGGDAKVLYFMTKTIKTQLIDRGIQERVTVVTSGLKAFVRNNRECKIGYRVAQEGLQFVAPHMKKRKFSVNLEDFEKCLSAPSVQIQELSEEFAAQVRELAVGAFVVYLKGYEDDYIKKLVIALWRCRGDTVNFLITQAEIDGMRSKLRAILKDDRKP
jgi:hypothetical protein